MGKKNLVDSLMESSGNPAPGSALDLVGMKHDSDDLLDEAVKGKLEAPSQHSAFSAEEQKQPGFVDAKEAARDFFEQAYGAESKDTEKEEPESAKVKELTTEAPASEKKEETVPDWWHTLNNESQAQRERQDNLERTLIAQQQQVLRALETQQHPAQTTREEEELAARYGFEDVNQFRTIKELWRSDMQKEIARQQAPIIQQMIYDRYGAAVARSSSEMEHFTKYFSPAKTSAYIAQLMQQYPAEHLAKVNWEHEFAQAYRAADYERLKREFENASQANTSATKTKDDEKAKKKADLKLVPKANQQGAGAKHGLAEELGGLPSNLSITQFGREMKTRLFNR